MLKLPGEERATQAIRRQIGETFRKLREEAKLSQAELARRLNKIMPATRGNICDLEKGRRIPHQERLDTMAIFLKILIANKGEGRKG